MRVSILVIEDEEALGILLVYNLQEAGFEIRLCNHGDQVGIYIAEKLPDLILLDWMLPGQSGIEICKSLRNNPNTRNIPVIMTTARGAEDEKLRGFDVGADDYLVKPFSMKELIARIKALLKRTIPATMNDEIKLGDIILNNQNLRVSRADIELDLGPTEFKLLQFLMQKPGRVFNREQLLDNVWGQDVYVDERTVDVHIGRLRKSLQLNKNNPDKLADPIRTIRGAGYSFDDKF